MTSADVPRFAVVGRVNKGKSSIVATLAEDDSVRVDPRPGTTTEVREYPVRVDGRMLFVLVDTPGFEDAPRARSKWPWRSAPPWSPPSTSWPPTARSAAAARLPRCSGCRPCSRSPPASRSASRAR